MRIELRQLKYVDEETLGVAEKYNQAADQLSRTFGNPEEFKRLRFLVDNLYSDLYSKTVSLLSQILLAERGTNVEEVLDATARLFNTHSINSMAGVAWERDFYKKVTLELHERRAYIQPR